MGERAVARVFLADQTFKTFFFTPSTTVAAIVLQMQEKMHTEDDYFMYYQIKGEEETYLKATDCPYDLLKKHGDGVTFFFKDSPPAGLATGGGPQESVANLLSSGAGRGMSSKELLGKSSAQLAAAAVSDSDFDALLDQLNVDLDSAEEVQADVANLPLCSACGEPIKSNPLKAFGMFWHRKHLACAICHRDFQENDVDVVEGNDGNAYCQPDFLERYAPKCARCEKAISGLCTNALGKTWHTECFTCMTCSQPFPNTFYEHEGMPYCEKDYFQKLGLLCPTCERPIIGKCVNARGTRFHNEHFSCAHCRKRLKSNVYYWNEAKSRPYCKDCSISLFG